MSQFRLLLAVLLPCALAMHPSAQALYRDVRPIEIPGEVPRVWTVDDSGGADFTDLPPAVLEANAGDVLLVAPGNYTAFTAQDKGLTILGDGGVPTIVGPTIIRELPPEDDFVLRGLRIKNIDLQGPEDNPLQLEGNEGTVWIENCFVQADPDWFYFQALRAEDNASVALIRTDVIGGKYSVASAALTLERSDAHFWECEIRGSSTSINGGALASGAIGAFVLDSFLYAAGSSFQGGQGKFGSCCSPCGGLCFGSGEIGGTGLDAAGAGTPPITLACSFQGGLGGASPPSCSGCTPGPTGSPTIGEIIEEDLPSREYLVTTPVRSGTSYQLSVHCEPGEFVWSVFSERLDPVYVPNYFGTQVSPLPVTLVFEGVAGGTGSLVKTVPVPPLAGLTTFERLFAQGLFFDEFNNAYLGSPSVLVVVN